MNRLTGGVALADGLPMWLGAVGFYEDEPTVRRVIIAAQENGCILVGGRDIPLQPWRFRLDMSHRATFLGLVDRLMERTGNTIAIKDGQGFDLASGAAWYDGGYSVDFFVTPENIRERYLMHTAAGWLREPRDFDGDAVPWSLHSDRAGYWFERRDGEVETIRNYDGRGIRAYGWLFPDGTIHEGATLIWAEHPGRSFAYPVKRLQHPF